MLLSLRSDNARRARTATLSAGVAVAISLAATAPAGATVAPRRHNPPAEGSVALVLVDSSRATPATSTQAAASTRTLPTTVRFPTAARERPLPLIVLAHGLNGHPDMLDDLAETWVKAGFVVATPQFPRTNIGTDGKAVLADVKEYPADLSFVITSLLALSTSTAPGPLHGRIDPQHVGAAGVSLGGMAVYGLMSHTCCRDRRVTAAILMAAVRPALPHGHYARSTIPVMLLHGDADTGYHHSVQAYPGLGTPKWFITLRGGSHGPPFEDPPDEFDGVVRATTTAFWQRYLSDERGAARRIARAVERSHGGATLHHDLGT